MAISRQFLVKIISALRRWHVLRVSNFKISLFSRYVGRLWRLIVVICLNDGIVETGTKMNSREDSRSRLNICVPYRLEWCLEGLAGVFS